MSRCCCFLCASDEGVFLEITPDSVRAAFGGQLEACLSKKVNKTIKLSNKICYKCAYELDQCAKFLQKSKKSYDVAKSPKAKAPVPHCSLCCESIESVHIFDITEDNRSVFSPLQKIRRIFSEDLAKKVNISKLVCLVCRYNLDVLYDLKKLHEQSVDNLEALLKKELDYSGFPKVYTDVVNRKTTITTFPDTTVHELISSDSECSEYSDMARGKKRGRPRGRPRGRARSKAAPLKNGASTAKSQGKYRNCEQCCNPVANDMDMYRVHSTGQILCKSCWTTRDPSKSTGKRQTFSLSGTKLCTVYLTDVLDKGIRDSENKVEKNKEDDKFYLISDESSFEEDKNVVSLKNKPTVNGSTERGKKRSIVSTKSDEESMPSKLSKPKSVTVQKVESAKALSDLDQPSTSFQKGRSRKRKVSGHEELSSESDQGIVKGMMLLRGRRQVNHLPTLLSTSEEDDANKALKKQKKGDKETIKEATKETTKEATDETTIKAHPESNDESSTESGSRNLRRKTKVASVLVAPTANTKKTEAAEVGRESRSKMSSVSFSQESTPPVEFKSPKEMAPQEYTCDKCDKKFDTKLAQAQHKLTTHNKQLALTLERVTFSSLSCEKIESSVDLLEEDKTTSEEATETKSSSGAAAKDAGDSPSEEVNISIDDDDDDDDDIFEYKPKKDDKDDGEKEQPLDAEASKSQREDDESMTKIPTEAIASESQPCADLTTVSAVTITEVNEKEDEDVNTKLKDRQDEHANEDVAVENHKMLGGENEDGGATAENEDATAKNEDATAENEDATAENEDAAVENEDAAVENEDAAVEKEDATAEKEDTGEKTPAAERMGPVIESDVLVDETIPNNEKTDEPVVPSITEDNKDDTNQDTVEPTNEDYDGSFEGNLQDSCEDNGEDGAEKEDAEVGLLNCVDITNDSEEEEDLKGEVKKKRKITPDTTDERIALDDKEDLYDTAIECAEKHRQNAIEAEVIDIDELDDNNTIKSTLTNCEAILEVENEDGEENDVVVTADGVDDAALEVKPNKATTEETSTIDLTMDNGAPTVGNFEPEMIDETAEAGEKREVQENTSNVSTSTDTVTKIMEEVFDLAAAEVQKRRDSNGASKNLDEEIEMETLENISREIRNSADMPSLDPISAITINDEETDITALD
ncbi:PREDICTED: transcriptional regulator ATRX-like [Dinoponera quadriceps]|uniref:Transcriptional regulator ATRX-like n=1 Tax=Dinoponera quadriceps TaxID=609295 RepID=A0A6P3Y5H1_DINQU|nr:PREDICTED: transcriptional regulator ATRX-like [Dinoponera quadriceps]